MLVAGTSVSEIARRLHLSVKTVSTHKTNLLAKMKMSSVAELVRYAIEHRLTDLSKGTQPFKGDASL
jgi:DNA-binding NarL/FixJ family response regulator